MANSRLLLIEPSASVRADLEKRLAADGWEVDTATDIGEVSGARQQEADVAVVAIPPNTRLLDLDPFLPVAVDIVAVVNGDVTHCELAANLAEVGIAGYVRAPIHYSRLREAIQGRDSSVTPTHFAHASALYTQGQGEVFAVGRGTTESKALADLGRRIEAQMATAWPPPRDEVEDDEEEEVCAIDITLTSLEPFLSRVVKT